MTDQLAVVENSKPPIVVLREKLEARKNELRAALLDITPEQFIRALITSATINPELQATSWPSLWLACMQACRDGLLPDGVEGAIVPYKSRATWIPMVQGMLRRARRSGQFKSISANVVREGDTFRYFEDENGPKLYWEPGTNPTGAITKVYARATTKDGGIFIDVMSIEDANKRRNMSRATRDDAPWKMWPEEMYKKTVLRRLSKTLPNARDIIPDDDDEIEMTTAPAPAQIMRAPGAAAALEQFGASPADVGMPSDEAPGAAEQGPGEPSAASDDDTRAPAPAIHDDLHAASITAYKAGQAAKSAGHSKKAIPPEYRDTKRTREALAWQSGYDGQPMPEFDASGKVLVP